MDWETLKERQSKLYRPSTIPITCIFNYMHVTTDITSVYYIESVSVHKSPLENPSGNILCKAKHFETSSRHYKHTSTHNITIRRGSDLIPCGSTRFCVDPRTPTERTPRTYISSGPTVEHSSKGKGDQHILQCLL